MGFIAAVIEKMGFDVKILDCFGLELSKEETFKEIDNHNPNILLVGAVTSNFNISMELLKKAKEVNPAVVNLIGGPHVTGNPASAFEEAGVVDFAVMGEAEETIVELLDFIKKRSDVPRDQIKGIMFVDESGNKVKTADRGVVKSLDSVPMPAYHLFPMEKYHSYGWLNLGRKFSTMITSRGCPFKCIFCQSSRQAQFWRQRSADIVFEEIKLLYDKYGIRHLYFQDDDFCVNHQRIIDICDKIKEAKMDIAWECLSRVNHVDEELLSAMASAGCRSILFGVETGYEEGFKKINKPITCDMVVNAVKLSKKCGMMVKLTFILGFPWEGEEEMRKTISFAKKANADLTFFNVLNPYPGTPVYEEMIQKNLFEQPDNFDSHIIHGTDPLIRTEKMSAKELRYWCGRAVLEFYLRPTYIWGKVKKINSWSEFKSNFSGGNDVLYLAFKKVVAGRHD
jgi:radical SAM superfamily enzyme YgiQ (UPF0313 family)